MDYEIKYVIAIFLIVKIAALSPEFSINEKKEKLEQNHGPVETLAGKQTPVPSAGRPHWGPYIIWGPEVDGGDEMKVHSTRDDPKSEKAEKIPSFDICEYKIESLENSLNWRNIQKTLRWLNRVLSSNRTEMEICRKRKIHKPKRSFTKGKTTNFDFVQSKKSFSKTKKIKLEKRLNIVRANRFRGGEKRIKKKRKYKSWRKLSKNEKKKLKSKWKGSRHEKKNFRVPPHSDSANIFKPNSAFFEQAFLKKAKNRSDRLDENSNLNSLAVKAERNCVYTKSSEKERKGPKHPEEDCSREPKTRGHDPDSKLPQQKAKPWPHFVYHRVSSNFFHPEMAGHNLKPSAYVAISVATSSKPETTDNVQGNPGDPPNSVETIETSSH